MFGLTDWIKWHQWQLLQNVLYNTKNQNMKSSCAINKFVIPSLGCLPRTNVLRYNEIYSATCEGLLGSGGGISIFLLLHASLKSLRLSTFSWNELIQNCTFLKWLDGIKMGRQIMLYLSSWCCYWAEIFWVKHFCVQLSFGTLTGCPWKMTYSPFLRDTLYQNGPICTWMKHFCVLKLFLNIEYILI